MPANMILPITANAIPPEIKLNAVSSSLTIPQLLASISSAAQSVEFLEARTIRGVLGELHKAGKANRFAEDTAAELARVLPVINAEAPSLTRPPTTGGGSPGARVTPAAPGRKSLVG